MGQQVLQSDNPPVTGTDAKALTWRSVLISLWMVLLWTVGCCFMVGAKEYLISQHILLTLGFGAILTIMLLQFPRLFAVAILVVMAGLFLLMPPAAAAEDKARIYAGLGRTLIVFVPMLLLSFWVWKRRLGRGELAVIYACVVIAIPWCIGLRGLIESSTSNLFDAQRRAEPAVYSWLDKLPWWAPRLANKPPLPLPVATTAPAAAGAIIAGQAPADTPPVCRTSPKPMAEDDRAVTDFMRGNGGKVPWNLWWRPMLYWSAMALAFEGMLMGLLLMFRKRWIEHERLPFVWTYPALFLIRGEADGMPAKRRWVSFFIGLAFCLPAIWLISPGGEAPTAWRCLPWAGWETVNGLAGGVDLTSLNLIPGVNLRLFWGPLVLTLFLLFPLDMLLTVALTYIFMSIILPGMMNSMGFTLGPGIISAFIMQALRIGGAIGLLFWSIWFNRRTLWGYLRCLWGAKPTVSESRDELSRGLVTLMFLGGLVGFIVLGSYATTTVQMLCLVFFTLIFGFTQARARVEGMPLLYENNCGSHLMVSIEREFLHDHYALASVGSGANVSGNSWAANWMQWGFTGQFRTFGPHNMLLEVFQIGHELRLRARSLALAVGVTMLLVVLIVPPLYLKLIYLYGYENSYQGAMTTFTGISQWAEQAASYGVHSASNWLNVASPSFYERYRTFFFMLYGFSLIGVLFHLRREFPRFPINPVGVVVAAEAWNIGYGAPFDADKVWFSFLLAGVVKLLIFRWMGVKTFQEKVQPVVLMLLCGMILGIMLYVLRYASVGIGVLK